MSFELADYDYDFPEELVAHQALEDRSASKMLHYALESQALTHQKFVNLPEYLKEGDLLILNESKVLASRFYAQKSTGKKIEVLLTESLGERTWRAIGKPKKSLKEGMKLDLLEQNGSLYKEESLEILSLDEGPFFTVKFLVEAEEEKELFDTCAWMPLPPYIKRDKIKEDDFQRYQTVYSQEQGSVAAPTAGLHFTEAVLESLKQKGVKIRKVVLHVGLGTFLPVQSEDIREHNMHEERFSLDESLMSEITEARKKGSRLICVGTTSMRVIESVASGEYEELKREASRIEGKTKLYLYPGKKIHVTDGLLTNFHQPKSSLMLLVSTLVGREKILELYQKAIAAKYRLFSYGDCMLLL